VSKHSAPDLNTFAYLNYVIGLRDPVQEVSLLGGTKSKILHELRERDQTARDVAARLRVQVSAARKHLERLKELGLVEEQFVRQGPGRPKKLYLLTDAGKELFPRRYDAILNAVLARITRDRGGDYAEQLLSNVADDTVKDIGLSGTNGRARLNRLIAALNDLGFDASVQRRNRVSRISRRTDSKGDRGCDDTAREMDRRRRAGLYSRHHRGSVGSDANQEVLDDSDLTGRVTASGPASPPEEHPDRESGGRDESAD